MSHPEAFQYYTQLRAQGKAPSALRWSRLKSRHDSHWSCVSNVQSILEKVGCTHKVIEREEMHRGQLDAVDLVITVGGDGTVLNAASYVIDDIPVLGINSDPTPPEEMGAQKKVDERRSRGALCSTTAQNIDKLLPLMLTGDIKPKPRSRLMCLVQSTHTETRLPPVLNDILIAHPVPAQVSRFRMTCYHDTKNYKHKETFYDHRASPADMKTVSE
jgi:NAD+ kinase